MSLKLAKAQTLRVLATHMDDGAADDAAEGASGGEGRPVAPVAAHAQRGSSRSWVSSFLPLSLHCEAGTKVHGSMGVRRARGLATWGTRAVAPAVLLAAEASDPWGRGAGDGDGEAPSPHAGSEGWRLS